MLAGHETTSTTVTWALYELSENPECQSKVREEIRAIRADVTRRGHNELTIGDLDSMKYLVAVLKVRLATSCHKWFIKSLSGVILNAPVYRRPSDTIPFYMPSLAWQSGMI